MALSNPNSSLVFDWSSDGLVVICSGEMISQKPDVDCNRAMSGLRFDGLHEEETDRVVTVRLDQIGTFDTSGVCWLLLLQEQICRKGIAMRVEGANPKLRGVLRILEVTQELCVDKSQAVPSAYQTAAGMTL